MGESGSHADRGAGSVPRSVVETAGRAARRFLVFRRTFERMVHACSSRQDRYARAWHRIERRKPELSERSIKLVTRWHHEAPRPSLADDWRPNPGHEDVFSCKTCKAKFVFRGNEAPGSYDGPTEVRCPDCFAVIGYLRADVYPPALVRRLADNRADLVGLM